MAAITLAERRLLVPSKAWSLATVHAPDEAPGVMKPAGRTPPAGHDETMRPVATEGEPSTAPVGPPAGEGPESVTANVSLSSVSPSLVMGTVMVLLAPSPFAQLSVPLVAVKSLPASALPLPVA